MRVLLQGADAVAQPVKLLAATLASDIRLPAGILKALLLTQLPA